MTTESARSPSGVETRTGSSERPIVDRVLGVVGGAMILLAVVLLIIGGEEDGGPAATVDTPGLELVQPRHGATVRTENLVVVFRVDGELTPKPGGWGTDSLHLHLRLNTMELMPSAGDIERGSDGLYRWVLPRPGPGLHTVQLFWSGPDHRPVQGSGSRTVQVQVED